MNETNQKEVFLTKLWVVVIGALVCCFLWGSAFPFIKIGYRHFGVDSADSASQILFGGIRFMIAGVMAILFGSVLQKKMLLPRKEEWKRVVSLSSLQTIGQYVLFYIGLARTTGVRGSIVEGTNVFVAIVVASLIFHQEKMTARKVIGSAIGFVGVVIIALSGGSVGSGNYLLGDSLIFASTVCYAFSSVLLKRFSKESNTVMLSGYQFVVGGMVMTLIGALMGGSVHADGTVALIVLFYLGFISAAAYSLWGILLTYNPISRVAVIGFMNPVFGVILSAILLSEGAAFGVTAAISLLLICSGIVIVNK